MSNFGLFFFFRPDELNSWVWSPIAQKITALYFFPLVCTSFSSKNVCKKQAATGCFADFIVRENKLKISFACRSTTDCKKHCRVFFAYILTGKRSTNQRKKIQGCDLLLNRRAHAKIQLIWVKKKKQTKIWRRMVTLRRLQFKSHTSTHCALVIYTCSPQVFCKLIRYRTQKLFPSMAVSVTEKSWYCKALCVSIPQPPTPSAGCVTKLCYTQVLKLGAVCLFQTWTVHWPNSRWLSSLWVSFITITTCSLKKRLGLVE